MLLGEVLLGEVLLGAVCALEIARRNVSVCGFATLAFAKSLQQFCGFLPCIVPLRNERRSSTSHFVERFGIGRQCGTQRVG
jgi:hypothetical protein